MALWSVSIEEQFYLTWPFVVRKVGRSTIIRLAIGLWLFSIAARAVVVVINRGPVSVFIDQATPCRLDAIAVGLALAATDWRCGSRLLSIASVTLVLLAGFWVFKMGGVFSQVFGLSLVSLGCGGLVASSLGAKYLRNEMTEYLGRISYGLYVFHGPGIIVGRFAGLASHVEIVPVAAAFTFAAAATSYRYLERPFLLLKKRFEHLPSRPV